MLEGREGGAMKDLGENILGRENSQCKGPGVNCLVCLRERGKEARVAGVQ